MRGERELGKRQKREGRNSENEGVLERKREREKIDTSRDSQRKKGERGSKRMREEKRVC